MAVTCPACGFASPAARFCGGCGASLSGVTGTSPTKLQHGEPEAERKLVTVLFADMCASLEQLAGQDPEEAVRVLDPVVEAMIEAVRYYGGTVTQVLGDGIMAVFGAPVTLENHAVSACRAAIRMQAAVARLAADRAVRAQTGPRIRIGLNSGEVVASMTGSDRHGDYTTLGPTTHVAACIEQLARPGTVLATAHTVELAEGFVSTQPAGRMPVKGLAAPVDLFEVVGSGPARSRFQVAQRRGLSRFVGRQREWAVLEAALERAVARHGQVVVLQGEPGVGKSRLAEEFLRSRALASWDVLHCHPLTYRTTPPYEPVIAMLRRYFAVPSGSSPDAAFARITERLRPLGDDLAGADAACASLLDLPIDDADWDALDPRQRRRRIHDAVLGILVRESRRTPVALLLEDLHRMDAETLSLADGLAQQLEGERLLMIAAARLEHEVRWRQPWVCVVPIDKLQRAQAAELVDSLLGGDPSLAGIKAELLERTGGNPLFIEETVRSLVEQRTVSGSQANYHAAAGSIRLPAVPDTVRAVIGARIDRLPARYKSVLQCAAVIGRDVPGEVLRQVSDAPDHALTAALAALVAADFLEVMADSAEDDPGAPRIQYRFRHALIHDVAYATVLFQARRDVHGRVVHVMEALWADRLDAHAEQLAHHAVRAELHDKAVAFLRLAAALAPARSGHRDAVAALEEVLRALDRLPPDPEHLAARIDAIIDMRTSLAALGAFDRALPMLEQALAAADALGDERRRGWVSAYIAQSYYTLGAQEPALQSAARALAIGERLDDVPLQAGALAGLGQAHHMIGEHAAAKRDLRRAMQLVDGSRGQRPYGFAGISAGALRIWLVNALLPAGRFEEAAGLARQAIVLGERAGSPWTVAASHLALGLVVLARGEGATAHPPLDRGLAIAQEYAITAWTPMLLCAIGLARARCGRLDEGRVRIEEGLRLADGLGIRNRQSLRFIWLAEACLRARAIAAARAAVDQADVLAARHGERGYAAWTRFFRGEILRLENEDPGKAVGLYAQARAAAGGLAMPALVAACELGLGRLLLARGEPDQAHEHLASAAKTFSALGMSAGAGCALANLAWCDGSETGSSPQRG